MKLRVLSDLHVEVAGFAPPPGDADLIVLAGDIHNGESARDGRALPSGP